MTGLDPARDVIVEIATIVTDDALEIVAEGPDLVVHQPDDVLALMDDFVRDMHTRSGLLEAIKASTMARLPELLEELESRVAAAESDVYFHSRERGSRTRTAR